MILKFFRNPDIRANFFLIAWPLIYFFPITLGQQVWYGTDIIRLFHPFGVELSRALNAGRLPLWTPNLLAGFPLLAEGQIAALYPPNWILFRLLPAHFAISASILLHLAWAGVGMYWCARAFNLQPASAMLAGFIFSFNGFMFEQIVHPPIIVAAAWLPWLIFLQTKFFRAINSTPRRAALYFLLASLAIGIQFTTGSAQIAFLNALTFAVIGTARFFWRDQSVATRDASRANRFFLFAQPFWFGVAFPLLLGAGIAAIQIMPTAELIGYSVRGNLPETFSASYAMPPEFLAQFLFPFAQGEPSESNNEYWGYFSIAGFLLAVLAPIIKRDRRTIFIALFAIGALSLTVGDFNPINQILLHLPVFNFFRVPARFMLIFIFFGALLAATALAELARRTRKQSFVGAIIGLTIVDLALVQPFFTRSLAWMTSPANVLATVRALPVFENGRVYTDQNYFPSIPALRNSLFPNLALAFDKPSVQIFSSLAFARSEAFVANPSAAMLNLLNARYLAIPLERRPPSRAPMPSQSFAPDVLDNESLMLPTTVRAIEITTFVEGATNLPDGFVAGEIELRRADGMLEKFPLRIGIETAEWDYERASAENKITHRRAEIAHSFPAFTRAFARAFDGNTYRARFEFAPHEIVGIKVHALLPPTRLIVENIFFTDEANQTISLANLTGRNNFSVAYWSDTVAVWKNLDALPRVFIAHAAQVMNDDAAFARLRENDFQPAQSVLLAEENSVGELKSQASGVDSVRVTRAEPERVEIFARTDQRGYLLLADSWYPGWNARVDGIATPIYRADIIFRAVALEPGEHTIIFEYQPISFALGGALSALSLFITFAFARRMARAGGAI